MKKNSSTKEVYDTLVEKINLTSEIAKYFAIFEIVEQSFERKLQSHEFPYNLYIQNIQNTSAASTCLVVKKWFFNLKTELELSSNDMLETFFFYQAIEDVNKVQIKAGNKLYKLKALQEISKKSEVCSWLWHFLIYPIIICLIKIKFVCLFDLSFAVFKTSTYTGRVR